MTGKIKENLPVEYHLTIKDLPVEMRPRERMLAAGPQSLSNTELLAILLRTGTAAETALQVAARMLSGPDGLRYLIMSSMEELKETRGVGLAKAAQIKAAVELGRRMAAAGGETRPVIKSPADVASLLMEEMRYLDREHFRAVCLNTKNLVLGIETISVGGLSSALVHPRELFKNAIKRSSAALILVHNHPSGDPSPSREDVEITKRLAEAGRIIGIEVLDHVVLGDQKYISLKEQALF